MTVLSTLLAKKLQRIHFHTDQLANDILAGAYRSAFKGKGMEFEEVREYQSGDDVRAIDWNVTARMQQPYVKHFREERELSVNLLVDISASTCFGTQHQLKSELMAEVAAVIAFSAIKNQDKVSLILFSDEIEAYIPPGKGTRHVLRIIRELLIAKPQHRHTDVGAALSFFSQMQHRAGICFLLSDFLCDSYANEAAIIAQHHDLIALAFVDGAEERLPSLGLTTFEDLESGQQQIIDTSLQKGKSYLQQQCAEHLQQQQQLMQRLGAGFVTLHTNRSYIPPLRKFFISRQRRIR